jgi:predicted TIM-barrel fold metal-dependent hydrolase
MANQYVTIDNHVHIAGPGDKFPDDFYWHERFRKGIGFTGLKALKGWSFRKITDQLMINALLVHSRTMRQVDYAVLLAFDHVYDVEGNKMGPDNGEKSTMYVSNKIIDDLSKEHRNLLKGISVHPFRNDAVQELDRYQEDAVLCKWMASSQMIDFENPAGQEKLDKFFDKMVEIKLPLLYHTGVETSIPCAEHEEWYEKFNSPKWIRGALDKGVTIILAHCGCSYFDTFKKQPDPMRDEVLDLFREIESERRDWNLYADISALFSPFRKWKKLEEIFEVIPQDRLIYGSDFPNPAKGKLESILAVFLRYGSRNYFDRYLKISNKWLPHYYEDVEGITQNFHRLLEKLGRDDVIKRKEEQLRRWLGES